MEHNGSRHPPFMMVDGSYRGCCVLQIIMDVARGMRGLHEKGISHRDLKASNVLILGGSKLKVVSIDVIYDIRCFVADYEC